MTVNKVLDFRDDVDRPCVSDKEGGIGLASIEYSDDALIQQLEDCIQKPAIRNDIDSTMDNRMTITGKKWGGKQL